jgi:GNAT superfamily N-acetyltransferase
VPAVPVRLALAADLPALELALARAFLDDPMTSWVVGEADPDRRLAQTAAGFFRPALAAGLRRGHCYALDEAGSITAGAIWAPPDVEMLDDTDGAAFARALQAEAGDEALGRIMALGALVANHHPHDRPHFYLFVLGAAERGRGAGSAVLQPVLERCDADGLGAYLESSNARNVGFYERHGFEVQWEDVPAPDGPVMRGMWREPRR